MLCFCFDNFLGVLATARRLKSDAAPAEETRRKLQIFIIVEISH